MRKVGVRDEEALAELVEGTDERLEQQEGHWFDSDEPLFVDEVVPVRCDLPGRPGEFVTVQQVSDSVAKGRARFYRTQSQAVKRGQPETTSTVIDAEGLTAYIRQHAITDFYFRKQNGVEVRFNPKNSSENLAAYRKWTGKLGAWVDAQINRVNGWGEEEEEKRERFPEATA